MACRVARLTRRYPEFVVQRGDGRRQGLGVVLAALPLVVLVAVLVGAGSADGSGATAARVTGGVSLAKFKKLQKQVKALQAKVNALTLKAGPEGRQGPEGKQGPAGTAPACAGNGSGDEMVAAGSVCIDKYEVSVWSSPTGGTQYGVSSDNYPCSDDGESCSNIYARSVPGVVPSRYITYFQAQQALANVGKRLPTNAEWQQAVAGTPDTVDNGTTACNVSTGHAVNTGSRSACVSRFGAVDMVGNALEWVADWVADPTICQPWEAAGNFTTEDRMCLSGASATADAPGALIRGGFFLLGPEQSGPFEIESYHPQASHANIGFRGAR